MTPAENAFNSIYPCVLRIVSLHNLIAKCQLKGDVNEAGDHFAELGIQVEQLSHLVDAIEAGRIDDSLQTSISGVLNMMRRRQSHN